MGTCRWVLLAAPALVLCACMSGHGAGGNAAGESNAGSGAAGSAEGGSGAAGSPTAGAGGNDAGSGGSGGAGAGNAGSGGTAAGVGGSGGTGAGNGGSGAGSGGDGGSGGTGAGSGGSGAGSGGSGAGSGGDGGSGGTGAGSGGSGGDAGAPEVACTADPPVFPDFDHSCNDASDCAVGTRLTSCCGSVAVTGINVAESEPYADAALICSGQFPLCGCYSPLAFADDGSMGNQETGVDPIVECLEGVCTTSFIGTKATACGPSLTCEPDTEICVAREPVGPSIQYGCEPIPTGCETNRSCFCTASALCTAPFDACTDTAPNTVTCSCLQCQ